VRAAAFSVPCAHNADAARTDPYPTDYGVQFPGWPVNSTCKRLLSLPGDDLITAAAFAIQTFYNMR
jgi:hypothetical protein